MRAVASYFGFFGLRSDECEDELLPELELPPELRPPPLLLEPLLLDPLLLDPPLLDPELLLEPPL